ncbi:sulfotransferase family protein [Rhodovulum sp. DZ06]|uniref:sulfotransferase family protein n=1 Tax=Rhodovulum sp. DZ06 TaxID=3425126 RepID=UPI003D33CFED
MGFPGSWMSESGALVYRVVPKAACSTIGQVLHHADHGRWYDGDIHDAEAGILKWNQEDARPRIAETIEQGRAPVFTFVRNPYARVLSAFFDKVAGIQRNGRRYRAGTLPEALAKYGIDPEAEDFDQVRAFRRFLLFVRDTIRMRKPMDPDIHWSAQAGHVGTIIRGGGRYALIAPMEKLTEGLEQVYALAPLSDPPALDALPRFNEGAAGGRRREHPLEDFFDDLSTFIVQDVYRRDFRLFGYDTDPGDGPPVRPIDLDFIHEKLGR